MTDQIAELPTLDWKLRNLQRLIDEHVEKLAAQMDLLERCSDYPTEVGDTHAREEATAP